MRLQTSMPSMPGIITSSSTMSGLVRCTRFERVDAVHGGDDLEIFSRQLGLEQPDIGENVVDDENAGGHCGAFRKLSTVCRKLITEIGLEM